MVIVKCVGKLAEKKNVTMTQIALSWQFTKGVASPIIGATKAKYLDGVAGSLDVALSADEIACLEEEYQPHKIVGAL